MDLIHLLPLFSKRVPSFKSCASVQIMFWMESGMEKLKRQRDVLHMKNCNPRWLWFPRYNTGNHMCWLSWARRPLNFSILWHLLAADQRILWLFFVVALGDAPAHPPLQVTVRLWIFINGFLTFMKNFPPLLSTASLLRNHLQGHLSRHFVPSWSVVTRNLEHIASHCPIIVSHLHIVTTSVLVPAKQRIKCAGISEQTGDSGWNLKQC